MSARWAGAIVVLHGGKRLSWKVVRDSRYGLISQSLHCHYYVGRRPSECEIHGHTFRDPGAFDKAERWAASFPAHPDEPGTPPRADAGGMP